VRAAEDRTVVELVLEIEAAGVREGDRRGRPLGDVDGPVEPEDRARPVLRDGPAGADLLVELAGAPVAARDLGAVDLDVDVVDAGPADRRQEVLDRLDLAGRGPDRAP